MKDFEAQERPEGAPTPKPAGASQPALVAIAGRALESWMAAVAAAPAAALTALFAAVVGSVALTVSYLSVDTDSTKMLNPALPFQQRAEAMNQAFPHITRTIALVVQADTADDADAAAAALVERLAPQTTLFESVFSPSTDPFFRAHGFLYRDVAEVAADFEALGRAAPLIAELRAAPDLPTFAALLEQAYLFGAGSEEFAAFDPFYREAAKVFRAHAEGGSRAFPWSTALTGEPGAGRVTRIVAAQPFLDFSEILPAEPALAAVAAAIADLPPEIQAATYIGVTGDPALQAEELQSVMGNLGLSLTISLLAVAVILVVACRSAGRALLAFAALIVTLALTTGAASVIASPLNLVSVAFIVLMVGLGIDYAIHILLYLGEDTQTDAPVDRLRETGRALGAPLALSAGTTAVAFLAFTTTDFTAIAQLGLIGGVGVLIAFATAATMIPAVVALAPGLLKRRRLRSKPAEDRSRRRPILLALAIVVCGFAAHVATEATFDADPMHLRDPLSPSVVAFNAMVASDAQTPFRVSFFAEDAAEAEAAVERLSAAPEVAEALWLGSFEPTEQAEKLQLRDVVAPSFEQALSGETAGVGSNGVTLSQVAETLETGGPAQQSLASALRAFDGQASGLTGEAAIARLEADLFRHFPMLLETLSAIGAAEPVALEDVPAPIVKQFRSADGQLRVEVAATRDLRDADAHRAFAEAMLTAEPRVAGGSISIDGAGQVVSEAILQATLLSIAGATALAWATLGRFALVLAIAAPLALAGALTAAASVWLNVPFNYANVIVLPLVIGIGVDSGVHLAMRSSAVGARGTVYATSTPRAVFLSALTTVAAFGTLAISEHRGTASMGIMLAVGLTAALFAVLSTTPSLIRVAQRHGRG